MQDQDNLADWHKGCIKRELDGQEAGLLHQVIQVSEILHHSHVSVIIDAKVDQKVTDNPELQLQDQVCIVHPLVLNVSHFADLLVEENAQRLQAITHIELPICCLLLALGNIIIFTLTCAAV